MEADSFSALTTLFNDVLQFCLENTIKERKDRFELKVIHEKRVEFVWSATDMCLGLFAGGYGWRRPHWRFLKEGFPRHHLVVHASPTGWLVEVSLAPPDVVPLHEGHGLDYLKPTRVESS